MTQPALLARSTKLMKKVKPWSVRKIKKGMHLSDKLAELNHERNQAWGEPFTEDNARQAMLMFAGDVYVGLDAGTLDAEAMAWAQEHVGILSGLYGLLRPLDLIQPYRLEMGNKLVNLYDFWGNLIDEAVGDQVVVNLASNEYSKVMGTRDMVTPKFKDVKDGKARTISFFAKQARGAMTRWIIDNRVDDPEQLKECDVMGYRHTENFVFVR